MEIACSNVRPGETGAGGWDLDVTVDGVEGELTLLPRAYDGQPGSWGSPDHWVSSPLLDSLREDPERLRDALATIEDAAARAVRESDVDPAEASA